MLDDWLRVVENDENDSILPIETFLVTFADKRVTRVSLTRKRKQEIIFSSK